MSRTPPKMHRRGGGASFRSFGAHTRHDPQLQFTGMVHAFISPKILIRDVESDRRGWINRDDLIRPTNEPTVGSRRRAENDQPQSLVVQMVLGCMDCRLDRFCVWALCIGFRHVVHRHTNCDDHWIADPGDAAPARRANEDSCSRDAAGLRQEELKLQAGRTRLSAQSRPNPRPVYRTDRSASACTAAPTSLASRQVAVPRSSRNSPSLAVERDGLGVEFPPSF